MVIGHLNCRLSCQRFKNPESVLASAKLVKIFLKLFILDSALLFLDHVNHAQ